MGTAASRQEDSARVAARREHMKRCRERRRLMREAVRLRRHLAASHAGYLRSLTHAASALTRFAVGEPLPVSDHAPLAVIVHRPVVAPSTRPPLLRFIEQQRAQEGSDAVYDPLVGGAGARALSVTREEGGGGEELRMVVRHRSLAEVAAGLEEYFLNASVDGDAVSSLLEASNAEFKRGPNSILGALCCLSAPSVAHDRVDSINGGQRHSSTLQQLLAWEKKLYWEVKARERLQVQHDKKWVELRDQEYSRKIDVDVLKPKAAWDKAKAQLGTASQAVDASSAAIAELRDAHLARQLLGLCHATLDMWRAMRQHHEAQNLIAQQLRGLSSRTSMEPTTEIHHEATRALEAAMSSWCGALGHLAKHQRDYVHALHGWLKLTLQAPPDGAEAPSPVPVATELAAFVERWAQELDRVHCADVLKSSRALPVRPPERRAAGGAPRQPVLPRARPQVADAASGGEELLRLVRAGGPLAVAPGDEALGGQRHARALRARGFAVEGRDRRVPEDGGRRDAEAPQGHRRDEVRGGDRREGEAARCLPVDGRVLGVARECLGSCVPAWHPCAVASYTNTSYSFTFAISISIFPFTYLYDYIVYVPKIYTKLC